MKKPIRLWIFSDDHVGHQLGFTMPGFDRDKEPFGSAALISAWKQRRAIYDWQAEALAGLPPPDILLYNGDAIDGKGQASGGTEQLTLDRQLQVEQAAETIKWRANRRGKKAAIFMSYGTPYHTGKEEDWDDNLASLVRARKIGSVDNLSVRGNVINYRHFLSRSVIPHGRYTALAREKLWNDIWALRGEHPSAGIIIRSHVHYHIFCGGHGYLGLTTPAGQGYGSKFGARMITGTIDVGFLTMDIYGPNELDWQAHIWRRPYKDALEFDETPNAS